MQSPHHSSEVNMGASIEQSFANSTLANLSQAFEATWEVLLASDASYALEAQEELRHAVSGKLLQLAADGMTDRKELQRQVLESLNAGGQPGAKESLAERLRFRCR
jgi:hypothetical protein